MISQCAFEFGRPRRSLGEILSLADLTPHLRPVIAQVVSAVGQRRDADHQVTQAIEQVGVELGTQLSDGQVRRAHQLDVDRLLLIAADSSVPTPAILEHTHELALYVLG